MRTSRVLGLIPARSGSKGVPEKNLVDLGGAPLIDWTALTSLASCLSKVILSTDDPAIAAAGRAAGVAVPFLRPKELAQDLSSSIDVVLHAVESLAPSDRARLDAVMLLQPTSPFRAVEDINRSVECLTESGADSVISVVEVGSHHPARMKRVANGVLIDPPFAEETENQPRQTLPPYWIRNGAIYLSRIEVLMRRSFKGDKSFAHAMPALRSVNIDGPLDLLLARAIVNEGLVEAPQRPERSSSGPRNS